MGMTDRQFDTYQKSLLRDLERIEEEIKQKFGDNTDIDNLQKLKKDTEEMLKRP
jgi:hypothetical protein